MKHYKVNAVAHGYAPLDTSRQYLSFEERPAFWRSVAALQRAFPNGATFLPSRAEKAVAQSALDGIRALAPGAARITATVYDFWTRA